MLRRPGPFVTLWLSPLRVCLAALAPALDALAAYAAAPDMAGTLISLQGQVEVTQGGRRGRARPRQDLFVENAAHTGPASRAAILLVDETQLKLNANSTQELRAIGPRPGAAVPVAVVPPVRTIFGILQGKPWVRNRDKAGFFEIWTPAVTASIRGTEFNLAVAPDRESPIFVLKGLINHVNPFGAVQVGPGEGAVARVGQPPSKVLILRQRDAVQWSLYYPGIVSFRDYPFMSPDPQELEPQL